MEIKFLDTVEDSLLHIAVIVSVFQGKWIFCKHKERTTYEVPAGHREKDESIFDTAVRELYEETGALDYRIIPICPYSVLNDEDIAYGMLFFAEIRFLDMLPESEIEEIFLFDHIPDHLTYPVVQPILIEKVRSELHLP